MLAYNLHRHLHFNQEVDPTRTKTLRDRFAVEMRRRFNIITSLIRHAIVDKDVFGLSPVTLITKRQAMERIQARQFAFATSAQKVDAFMEWLEGMNKEFILSGGGRGLQTIKLPGTLPGIREAWTDTYIHSAYQKGVLRARNELVKAGYDVPSLTPGDTDALRVAFNLPIHADRVGLLATRTFSELKGITVTMEQQVGRVLAQGMADGQSPRKLAQLLTKTITGPVGDLGITDTLGRFIPARRRAELLARTEIIRAHHAATINEYKRWEVEGVRVQAEWQTAGDHRVCGDCASLQGKVFKLEVIENMIPFHPLCRCVALPIEARRTEARARGAEIEGNDLNLADQRWKETTKTVGGRQIPFYENPNFKPPKGKRGEVVTLFHETSLDNIPAIAKQGLRASETARGELWFTSKKAFRDGVRNNFYAEDVIVIEVPKKELMEKGILEVVPGQGTIIYDDLPQEWIRGLLRHYKGTPPALPLWAEEAGAAAELVVPKKVRKKTKAKAKGKEKVKEVEEPKKTTITEEILEERRQALAQAEAELEAVYSEAWSAEKEQRIFEASLKRDTAEIRYVVSLKDINPALYAEEREKIIKEMIDRGYPSMSRAQYKRALDKAVKGLEFVPYDVLHTLNKYELDIVFESRVRAHYIENSATVVVDISYPGFVEISHEVGHAIDHLILGLPYPNVDMSILGEATTGLVGKGNVFVTKKRLE